MVDQDYYTRLHQLAAGNEKCWQVTIVATEGSTPAKPGMKMAIPLHSSVTGNLGGGELEHLLISQVRAEQSEKPFLQSYALSESGAEAGPAGPIQTSMICGGRVSVFIEPLLDAKPLYIIGAGHCGRALAHLAGFCGFRPLLLDNRPEILNTFGPELTGEFILTDYRDLERHIPFSDKTLVVIMTHGHVHDQEVLEQCLNQPCQYLGMIGSARKVEETLRRLRDKGFDSAALARVHAPVGLPIGSQTPYEIAVSILAQLIQIVSGTIMV